jgi:hypothetical protein
MIAVNTVIDGLRRDLSTFTMQEQALYGVSTFKNISSNEAYNGWLFGPLRRTVVAPDLLTPKNLFVIAARGYVYEAPRNDPGDGSLTFCSEPTSTDRCNAIAANATPLVVVSNDSNNSNATEAPAPSCYASELSTCLNQRVVEVFQTAIDSCHQVPVCKPRYSWNALQTLLLSWVSEDQWSFIKGKAKTYAAGTRYDLNLTSSEGFQASLGDWYNIETNANAPAIMFLVLIYSPSLDSIVAFNMLIEDSLSGSLATLIRHEVIDLHMSDSGWRYFLYILAIIFSIGCFLMEIRRITQFPKRFAGLDGNQKERLSFWTLIFLLLPLGILLDFSLFTVRAQNTADDMLTLNSERLLEETSMDALQQQRDVAHVQSWLELVIILFLNMLWFRYGLMFFKQMAAVTDMVKRVYKPLLINLMYIFLVLMLIMVMLYVMYSGKEAAFRDPVVASMEVIRFASSGISNWYDLYEAHPIMWILIMMCSFVLITLFLNNLTIAIMLSHKKEMDLFQNANFHEFWNAARNRKKDESDTKRDFNPAMAGAVFTDDQDQ